MLFLRELYTRYAGVCISIIIITLFLKWLLIWHVASKFSHRFDRMPQEALYYPSGKLCMPRIQPHTLMWMSILSSRCHRVTNISIINADTWDQSWQPSGGQLQKRTWLRTPSSTQMRASPLICKWHMALDVIVKQHKLFVIYG